MIQLPSKIRTTYFTVRVEAEPLLLLSHEPDRIVALLSLGYSTFGYVSFGRTKEEAVNSDTPGGLVFGTWEVYGIEQLWMANSKFAQSFLSGSVIVHAIYKA